MEQQPQFKEVIGKQIAHWVIIATGVLGLTGITLAILTLLMSDDNDQGLQEAKEILQYVFTALLPLWGTWIGTVLAYYFSKENFEAANKSVRELVGNLAQGDKLKSIKVIDIMMAYPKIKKIEMEGEQQEDMLLIKTVYDFLNSNNVRRALIFREGCIVRVLHRGLLGEFILRHYNKLDTITIGDLKRDPDKDIQQALSNGAPTLPKDASLLDAKLLMESFPGCQDAFITETGKKTEKVLGWISNVDIFNNSKA